MAALFAFMGKREGMTDLLFRTSRTLEVCLLWSLTTEYLARNLLRAWYIGCALGLQPREEISSISARSIIETVSTPRRRTKLEMARRRRGQGECGLLAGHRIASPVNGVRFSALAPQADAPRAPE